MDYPPAPRLDVVDDLFGHRVADPYRWLEDASAEQTRTWSHGQDDLVRDHLDALPGRERLRSRLSSLLDVGVVGTPAWRGGRAFLTRRTAGQEHAVLLCREPDRSERVLIDPGALDPAGTTTLDAWQPDKEGRLLAYQLSAGGDEESLLRVLDVETGAVVDGPVDRTRYSPVAWLPGGSAYYYVRRLPAASVPAGEAQYHRRVWLHRVGDRAEDDVLVFGDGMDKTTYFGLSVSLDGRWLLVTASAGTAPRDDVWVADLDISDPSRPQLVPVQVGVDARTAPAIGRDGRLYLLTDRDAPRGRLCVADPEAPAYESWRELVVESADAVLEDYELLDGPALSSPRLVVLRSRHAVSEVTVHDLDTGGQLATVPLPGLGSVGRLSVPVEGGSQVWLSYTDYAAPSRVLRHDAGTGDTSVWEHAPGLADVALPHVDVHHVVVPGLDGTPVRMFVVSSGNSGPRPAILYGYGGFDIALTPAYSASVLAWVEAGGTYAVANLRGGSEEGQAWHRAGMREVKTNTFDDAVAAGRWLVDEGWTTPASLAVSGGSNGGLLVGAVVTRAPELFAAAVCSAPLLDMVRYELFGLGESWNDEYGTAADPVELGWLLSYSPYHAVRPGTCYPATLFTVFDSDTRVDPLHARKMCAALQHATSCERPVLLRRERDVGHSARSVGRTIDLAVDTLSFLAAHTGLVLESADAP